MARASLLSVALVATIAAGAALAEQIGDAEAGARVFTQCKGCHEIGAGARDRIGPHLNGIFGRRAAAHAGYAYSQSMTRAGSDGLVWTAETMDAFLTKPGEFIPKTKMNYPGLPDAQDRANVIAYVKRRAAK